MKAGGMWRVEKASSARRRGARMGQGRSPGKGCAVAYLMLWVWIRIGRAVEVDDEGGGLVRESGEYGVGEDDGGLF
jgi:hypothetical protein